MKQISSGKNRRIAILFWRDFFMNEGRRDVTSRVFGKMKGGSMSLYLDQDQIGQIHFTNQGNMYEMADGFEFESEKIFKRDKQPEITNPSKYVDECDKGWC
jgi:hypothetical protein